ncbi:MAG TPA: alanine racemase [Limnochordia bacterium]
MASNPGPSWWRPVWAEVDLTAIRENAAILRALAHPATLMAVVKADGYGHGAVAAAQAALSAGASWCGVATPDEGLALARAGIKAPILVLGAFVPGQEEPFCATPLRATVVDRAGAEALSRAGVRIGRPLPVHLKVDTGMGRLGVPFADAPDLAAEIAALPGIRLEGLYTHLATADEADDSWMREQLSRFARVEEACRRLGAAPRWVHALNSAGLLRVPAKKGQMVRAGLSLYGLFPSEVVAVPDRAPLRPAMSWKARVVSTKRVPAGTGISYGLTYATTRETTIAALPVGYADGYSRRLSGRAHVLIRGERFPVVGAICMDQCLVDVGDAPVAIGDEVVLLGRQGSAVIDADELAEWMGTISYEVLCTIGARVPRIYRGGGPAGGSTGG